MKNIVLILIFLFFTQVGVLSASSSNYKVNSEILDAGGGQSTSASYRLTGKTRDRQVQNPFSATYIIGEGFLKGAYPPAAVKPPVVAAPTITAITPAKGLNNEIVTITDLAGTNFRSGATAKLTKTGESDIAGENMVVESASKITCRFNLTGKAVGPWNVVVINDDGKSGALTQAFKIEAPVVEVVDGKVESSENPFNPTLKATSINYTLSKDIDVTIYVYNIRGERIWEKTITAGSQGGLAGANAVAWDGLTAFKSYASSGVYIVMVTAKVDGEIKTLARTKVAVVK